MQIEQLFYPIFKGIQINTHLVTKNFDLAVSSIDGRFGINCIIVCIDLNV